MRVTITSGVKAILGLLPESVRPMTDMIFAPFHKYHEQAQKEWEELGSTTEQSDANIDKQESNVSTKDELPVELDDIVIEEASNQV